jgi:hypothetical protein
MTGATSNCSARRREPAQDSRQRIRSRREAAKISIAPLIRCYPLGSSAACAAFLQIQVDGDARQRLAADVDHGDVERRSHQLERRKRFLGARHIDGDRLLQKSRRLGDDGVRPRLDAAELVFAVGAARYGIGKARG